VLQSAPRVRKREQPENERGAGLLDDEKYAPKLDVEEGEGGQRMS